MDFLPWAKYPALTRERLISVASVIRNARRNTVLLHSPSDGDDEWSLGCRAYARTCFAIRQTATKNPEWLEVLPDKQWLRFTFAIGGVPIRFYRGEPNDPPEKTFFVSYTELRQLNFASDLGITVPRDRVLRLAIETDGDGYAAGISLVELTEEQEPIEVYEIPIATSTEINIVPFQTKAIDLPPPNVEPLKKDDDEEQQHDKRDAS